VDAGTAWDALIIAGEILVGAGLGSERWRTSGVIVAEDAASNATPQSGERQLAIDAGWRIASG